MTTIIHFIDVGQGNMVLIEAANGNKFVFDCNITDDNEDQVLKYVANQIGWGTSLFAFICSHRDADHIRGVKILHEQFPIQAVWDSGYPGTTTDSTEYIQYLALRREVGSQIIEKQKWEGYGRTRFRYLSAKDDRLPNNANAQGVVIKVEHRSANTTVIEGSAILPGDSDAEIWRYGIMEDYNVSDVSSDFLMAAHHGSDSFFDDPADEKKYYTGHLKAISPDMTIVSVGKNIHGHPDSQAIKFYMRESSGSKNGNKVYRTDKQGTMKLTLKDGGGWSLDINQ